jgi:hypothetical protein
MTTKITVLRRWNNPLIEINVTKELISASMSMDDFIHAMTDEAAEPMVKQIVQDAGNPSLLFTNAQLEARLVKAIESDKVRAIFAEAADRIVEAAKQETSKVM